MCAASVPSDIRKEVIERMNVNIGIDIGKRKCDYCVLDSKGKVLGRGQYRNTVSDAKNIATDLAFKYGRKGQMRAACETTGNMWQITFDAFEAAGIDIKLANTYQMAIISRTAKKTDKVDSEKIANIVRMNMIPECYVPPADIRGMRAMIRQRIKLVQDRTRVINRMHSLLDRHDISVDAANMYSRKAMEQLQEITLASKHDQTILRQRARQVSYITEEITQMDTLLEDEAAKNDYARILASMTGMGIYTSLLLAVEIADIERFDTYKKIISWAGLCPTIHQSGDKLYMGRIKKMGTNRLVNWAMCEAANVAVLHDPRMKAAYLSAKRRHADKHALAIVVVANKMLAIAWRMLKTQTPYISHNERLYRRKLAKLDRKRK